MAGNLTVELSMQTNISREAVSIARVRGKLLAAMQRFAKTAERTAELATQTFESYTVSWESNYRFAGGSVVVNLATDSVLFKFLDEGTSHRWAVMNFPFEPKTWPGTLYATRGERGYNSAGEYTAIRGRRAMQERNMQAQPGIVARDISGMIAAELEDDFIEAIERAIDEGLF